MLTLGLFCFLNAFFTYRVMLVSWWFITWPLCTTTNFAPKDICEYIRSSWNSPCHPPGYYKCNTTLRLQILKKKKKKTYIFTAWRLEQIVVILTRHMIERALNKIIWNVKVKQAFYIIEGAPHQASIRPPRGQLASLHAWRWAKGGSWWQPVKWESDASNHALSRIWYG